MRKDRLERVLDLIIQWEKTRESMRWIHGGADVQEQQIREWMARNECLNGHIIISKVLFKLSLEDTGKEICLDAQSGAEGVAALLTNSNVPVSDFIMHLCLTHMILTDGILRS